MSLHYQKQGTTVLIMGSNVGDYTILRSWCDPLPHQLHNGEHAALVFKARTRSAGQCLTQPYRPRALMLFFEVS